MAGSRDSALTERGIRGRLGRGWVPADPLGDLTLVVLVSMVVYGITASPAMRRLDELRKLGSL